MPKLGFQGFPTSDQNRLLSAKKDINSKYRINLIVNTPEQPLADKLNEMNGQKENNSEKKQKTPQLLKTYMPASEMPNKLFQLPRDSDSDASSVKSMLQGREMPSHFDKENNYYMLYWKTYLENE